MVANHLLSKGCRLNVHACQQLCREVAVVEGMAEKLKDRKQTWHA